MVSYGQLESLSLNMAYPNLVKKEEGCKRSELEVSNMDIDNEHISKKPMNEYPLGSDIVIQEEEVEEVEKHEVPSHESIVIVQHFLTIETSQERTEARHIDPSTNLVSQYNTMRLQIANNKQEKYSWVRGGVKNKLVILSAPSHEKNVFNIVVLEPRVRPTVTQYYKESKIKINLEKISVFEQINLHNKIGEMIFSNLLQYTINTTNLKSQIT